MFPNNQHLDFLMSLMAMITAGTAHKMATNITNFQYTNEYGDDYGTQWIYFPDGDGVPRFVNLTVNKQELVYLQSIGRKGEMQLEFRLYTKNNMNNYIRLDNSGTVLNGEIDVPLSKKPIKIITHGWRSSVDKDLVIPIKNAYLETSDVNVIGLDWSTVAGTFYTIAAFQIWEVGVKVAEFLDKLETQYGVTGDQVHLIGHSLGAHVMGIAGHASQLNISRITGLDPALPLFDIFLYGNSTKLDASDAQYVDIIHTCGGLLGFMESIGTADFYPNGGAAPQPGCAFTMQNLFEGCSHARSHQFFMESIRNPRAFPSYKCDDWTQDVENKCDKAGYMGEPANMTGKFYLETNPSEPFGKGIK